MQAEKTVHVPDCLKDEDAISEPLACMLSAAMKLPIETLGDPVAVVGCGYMGLGMISLFRAMGYHGYRQTAGGAGKCTPLRSHRSFHSGHHPRRIHNDL